MQRASDKAYVSKRLIEKYQKEKEKQSRQSELQPIQEQNEDIAMQESIIQKAGSVDLLGMADSSREQKSNSKALVKNMIEQEAEEDDNDSAEDLDSDDLGDDLEDNQFQPFGYQLQQQPQPMVFQPPQANLMDFEMQQPRSLFGSSSPSQAATGNFGAIGQPQQQQQQFQGSLFGQPQQQQQNYSSASMNMGFPPMQYNREQMQMPQQQQQQQQPQQKGGIFSGLFSSSSKPQQQAQPQNSGFGGSAQAQSYSQQMMPPPQMMAPGRGASLFGGPPVQSINYNFNNNNQYLPQQPQRIKEKKGKYRQEVDTNVFQISMACLKDQGELATGDPMFCKQCEAAFNKHSKIEDCKQDEEQIWNCEFCNYKNKVQLEPEEIPKTEAVNYILEAAAQISDKKNKGTNQDISVVFCIDISGSMCVTQPVIGSHLLKGDKMRSMKAELMKFSDGSDQRLQGDHNVTYVSRLQCVQSAIESQLGEMQKNTPERKAGLVTFNNEVTIIGDGTKEAAVIAGDKLHNYDFLLQNGIESSTKLFSKPIKDTKNQIASKLMSLEETGPTALGPAIVTAIALAGEGAPGSSVILCTDGLANVGLGSFDEVFTEEQSKKVDEFYEIIGQYAKSKGVTVNIISIEGEECNIDTICKISDLTGGDVQRVNPKDLIENFSNILSLPTLATNVQLKVKIHKGLEFRNEEPQNLSADKTILARDLGNVTEETEVTFEYKLKHVKELVKMVDIDLTKISAFPFQAQITYTSLDGSRCVRVITNTIETSSDREELQQKADYGLLGVNAIQQSAKIARGGDLQRAKVNAQAWHNHMQRNPMSNPQQEQFSQFKNNAGGMYSLMSQQKKESEQRSIQPMMLGSSMQPPQYQARMNDAVSQNLYSNSRINTKQFQNKKK